MKLKISLWIKTALKQYRMDTCMVCDKPIEKPVCQECIKEEVREWTGGHNKKLLRGLMRKTSEFVSVKLSNNIKCTLCKRIIKGCSNCYIEYIQRWISKKSPDLLPSFKLFFTP